MSPKKVIERKCQMPTLASNCSCSHSPKKCAMQPASASEPAQPFCNYDTPKSAILSINKDTAATFEERRDSMALPPDENYDKPRNLIENELTEAASLQYSNYDVPPSSLQFPPMNVTPQCTKVVMEREDCQMLVCPCNRVFNWLSLPYCRRGYGIESSAVKMCKVQLIKNEILGAQLPYHFQQPIFHEAHHSTSTTEAQQEPIPTINKVEDCVEQSNVICESVPEEPTTHHTSESAKPVQTNYANLEFADSLMLYENSRDIINRVVSSTENKDKQESTQSESQPGIESRVHDSDNRTGQSCCKCGHSCAEEERRTEKENIASEVKKQDDYTLMDPDDFKDDSQSRQNSSSQSSKWSSDKEGSDSFQEYLHMSPLTNRDDAEMVQPVFNAQKQQLRSESISHFPASFPRQKSLEMCKVPGRPVPFIDQSSVSASSSPYLRRHLRFFKDDLCYQTQTSQFDRRRSNSVDYGNYLDSAALQNTTRKFVINSAMSNTGKLRQTTVSHETTTSPPLAVFDNDIVKAENNDRENGTGKRKTLHGDNVSGQHQIEASPVAVRRSCSVPCKSAHNRDSSSSNDSGVSAGSPKRQVEFELASCPEKMTSSNPNSLAINSVHNSSCIHSSLPRKSKSIDPLQELTFQFQIAKRSIKPSDETPAPQENKESFKGSGNTSTAILGIDSQSTSSATSDMSDYIETLSLSSYSSSDTPDGLRLSRTAVITLKPRSGKEYHKVDRCYIMDEESKRTNNRVSTTIPEKAESPSPGYASGSPGN